MALSTYSELQSAVLNWMARDSSDVIAGVLPDCIELVESKLNRMLRVAQMEANAIGVSTNGVLALPTDFLTWRRVEIVPYGPLELVTPTYASENFPTLLTGVAKYFTIQNNNLTTYPPYTGEVSLDYYQRIPALSDSNPTNWLLSDNPDVYLFMTLSEACAYSKDVEAALVWNQRGVAAIEEMNTADKIRRFSGARARVKGPTP